MNKISKSLWKYFLWKRNARKFRAFGKSSSVDRPLRVDGPENIIIGSSVSIKYKTWLAAMPQTDTKQPKLIIEDGSIIGSFNHIYATNEISIGKNVLIADKVYISDNLHSYTDPSIPIMNQPIKQLTKVSIGDGSWIGENVCIIGASIGRNSVIGANSVVTRNIPDFCVAVGAPARVIKQYNHNTQKWELETDIQ